MCFQCLKNTSIDWKINGFIHLIWGTRGTRTANVHVYCLVIITYPAFLDALGIKLIILIETNGNWKLRM
jgi:hypothetical protein